MTRFARSKGSKASNERVPEEATSWHIMKQQMEDTKREREEDVKKKEVAAVRKANYKNFLEEINETKNVKWANFTDTAGNKTLKRSKLAKNRESTMLRSELIGESNEFTDENYKMLRKNKKAKNKFEDVSIESSEQTEKNKITADGSDVLNVGNKGNMNIKPKKRIHSQENASEVVDSDRDESPIQANAKGIERNHLKNNISEDLDSGNDESPVQASAKVPLKIIVTKAKKLKLPQIKILPVSVTSKERSTNVTKIDSDEKLTKREYLKLKKKKKKQLRNAKMSQKLKKPLEELTEEELVKVNKRKQKILQQKEKRKNAKIKKKEKLNDSTVEESHTNNASTYEKQNTKCEEGANLKRKLPKKKDDGEEHKRRKPIPEVTTIYINEKKVEIIHFGGFPVKREDAQRLLQLKTQMRKKGIPRSEIQATLKLERRKAEKALSREKKKLCFNCRQSGHTLSECPKLNNSETQDISGTDICYKCGSTEHTHFECKVVRNQEYKFATCFICKEEGHISRQCPDNPRGIYPKGGACRVCGDVTHLKKDCPKYQEEQEAVAVTVHTLKHDNVEMLNDEPSGVKSKVKHSKSNKVIKF